MSAPIIIRQITLRHCETAALYRGQYTTGQQDPERHVWLVAEISDGTTSGYGECVPTSLYYPPGHQGRVELDEWAEIQRLASTMIGQDARQLGRLIPEDLNSRDANSIKDVLDFALHDLVGKVLGVPAGMLLGGIGRRKVPSILVIHTKSPEDMAEEANEEHRRFGIRYFKLKPIGNLEGDEATVRLMHEKMGDAIEIYADANYALQISDPDEIVKYLNTLHRYGLTVYEDPIEADLDTYRYINDRTPVRLMIDAEARTPEAVMAIIQKKAASQINIHANWSAGFWPGLRKAQLAALGGMPTMVGSTYYLGPGSAAYQILSAALPLVAPCEQQFMGTRGSDYSIVEPFELKGGDYHLPDKPGLGIEIDTEKLASLTLKETTLS